MTFEALYALLTTSVILQIIASITTLAAIWVTGNKHWYGPALALVSDAAFCTLNLYLQLYALIPMMIAVLVLHIRNVIKWRKEHVTL